MAPAQAQPSASPQRGPLMEEEEEEEEEVQVDMMETSYHPSAPSSELFDMRTTVDPSFIISLIRKLVPHHVKNGHAPVQQSETQTGMEQSDAASPISSSGILNSQTDTLEVAEGDKGMATANDAIWEECGCTLWDLAVNKNHAIFMVDNLLLEVIWANLAISPSLRITEIALGILANVACHEVLSNRLVSMPGLIDTVVDQLFLDDSLCLGEAFRLLKLGLQGIESATWAKTLQPEHILRRILWVAENTLNLNLLEKSTSLLLAIVDSQPEALQNLLPQLVKLGLPDLLTSLLVCEMKHLSGERVPDRYSILDNILRVFEALSVLDNYSKMISSNKELLRLVYDLVKLSDKVEVSSSCVTATVLIANILTDEPELGSEVSQDLFFLQGLLGHIPFVSKDLEAWSALWSVLGRVLVWVQEDKMSPLSLHQYVTVLVDKSDYIEDDIIDHPVEDCNEDHPGSNTSLMKEISRTTSLSRIQKILQRWTAIRENTRNDIVGEDIVDDGSVNKLLQCCKKYTKTVTASTAGLK